MKAVLASMLPYYVWLIMKGLKRIEVRKSFPKAEDWNKKVAVYCSKNKKSFNRIPIEEREAFRQYLGKVIGEFFCDSIIYYETEFSVNNNVYQDICEVWVNENGDEDLRVVACNETDDLDNNKILRDSCLTIDTLKNYVGLGFGKFYTWHITDLKIYDKPKELSELKKTCIWPKMPYCPNCPKGGEYINETEAEFYRIDGECNTEWYCNNYVTKAPQSWCYVEELQP